MKKGSFALMMSLVLPLTGTAGASDGPATRPDWLIEATKALETELVETYGEAQRNRAARGLSQIADFWRADDGDKQVFKTFVRRNFAGDVATLDTTFSRFEKLLEKLD